ncbi:nucleoside deaminase [Candidatus Uhrbacteria bacterium]|nr:nucleoside deaminase [Candidatus Uhrbacteria bacterium]
MNLEMQQQDEKFIRRCIELSEEALKNRDKPFGSLITENGNIIVEASNDSENRVSNHAEIIALNKAHQMLGTSTLAACTLYSNCEPCPMCSFMIREFKIKRVVFALSSLYMGGYSKWNILEDVELSQFKPFFGNPPEVVPNVLEDEAKRVFDKTPLWMFGSKAKNTEHLKFNL